jgi:hypothetical protein
MMTVRNIDKQTGDIVTSGIHFISGQEEIAQTITTRLRLFLGEYFRDVTDGTPWFQQILTKRGNLSAADSAIKLRIARTDGVVSLTSFNTDYDIDTRVYSVSAGVLTTFGEINISLGEVI